MKEEKLRLFINEIHDFVPSFRKSMARPPSCDDKKLPPHQFFCVHILYKSGSLSMSDLAVKLGVSSQQLTRVVGGAEQNGLAERFIDPNNRRVVKVKLTESGRELFESMQKAMTSNFLEILDALTEEEIDACRFHLSELVSILRKIEIM